MKSLYKWQKITLWVIGILTFISVTFNTIGKEFNIGYFLDLITAIGVNLIILWIIFIAGNWIYKKIKKGSQTDERKN